LPELLQNCDRVMVMRKGHICDQFDAENLSEEELYHALIAEDVTGEPA
jgi:simple sugar transport system ATP-binding protein